MATYEEKKKAIQDVIRVMMDRVMDNVLYSDPFQPDIHRNKRPLYAALVPDEIFKGSHFERRFVTPFGKVWERLAIVAANTAERIGVVDYRVDGVVKEGRLRRITETLNRLEHPGVEGQRTRPDWDRELDYILEGGGDDMAVSVVCDVYCQDSSTGHSYAFELKAALPNSDITKVSKEKILKLYAMEPRRVDEAYFALPYNPYGRRENYAWSFPARWFDMKRDQVVLIGEEFWDKLGGAGTYQAFIEAVNEIGDAYKERIYREFLGIEPPDSAFELKL